MQRKEIFHVLQGPCTQQFEAYEVCLSAWKWKAADLIKFQNPSVKLFPDSLLQINTTALIWNAAALNAGSEFAAFMIHFAQEMGIAFSGKKKDNFMHQMASDDLEIPACVMVFTGEALPVEMGNTVGILKRVKNPDKFELDLILPSGPKFRVEVKDRKQIGSKKTLESSDQIICSCRANWSNSSSPMLELLG